MPTSPPHITLAAYSVLEEQIGKGFPLLIHLLENAFNLALRSHSGHLTRSHHGCGRGSWVVSSLLELFPAEMTPLFLAEVLEIPILSQGTDSPWG